jgi:hypothetical protein
MLTFFIFQEEQEKHRKALETELRKLQGFITEICVSFDTQLRQFFNIKLAVNQLLVKKELEMIKLHETLLYSEGDTVKVTIITKSRRLQLHFLMVYYTLGTNHPEKTRRVESTKVAMCD